MKVVHLIPCYDDPKHDFFVSHAELINFTKSFRPDIELKILTHRSTNLHEAREILVNRAREWGADLGCFFDVDHSFHPATLVKLIERDVDFVGVIFRRRTAEIVSNAAVWTATGWVPVIPTATKAQADELEEVHRIGLGLALIRMSALDKLERPIFESEPGVGEDVRLCDRLRAAGVKLYADHQVSMLAGHCFETVLTWPANTVAVPVPMRRTG